MGSWSVFLISIGCLLIMVSPQLPTSMMYLLVGVVLVILGALKLRKRKK